MNEREALPDENQTVPGEQGEPPRTLSAAKAAKYWTTQLAAAQREQRDFHSEARSVIDAYRNGKHADAQGKNRRFNVLYANTETMRGAIYAKSGKPDCRPRWSGGDPQMYQITRRAAEVMERALTVSIDSRAHESAYEAGVLLGCLAGRAVMRYEVETKLDDGVDAMGQPLKTVASQKVCKKLWNTSDFLHSPSESWDDVWWIAFRHKMTRADMEREGFRGAQNDANGKGGVPLNYRAHAGDGKPEDAPNDQVDRAEVWELWSKKHKRRFWICLGYPAALRVDDDPLGLALFWPMQEPLCFHPHVGETIVPQLDWWQSKKLADQLEELTNRIDKLSRQLKWRGVRDKSIKELKDLAKAPDNTFVAVENIELLTAKGGLSKAFEALDIKSLAETLVQAMQVAQQVEAKIDKMSGIADIMRGGDDGPGQAKTATEQNIKAQFGGIRIKTRQRAVQAWIRDGHRIEAELMCEHFEPEILERLTGVQIDEQLAQFLRDDKLRSVRIDVETDSTVFEDAQAEKEANAELINTATPLIEKAMEASVQAPELAEVIFEMLAMTLRSLKGGRQIEDVIDRAREQMGARIKQMQQNPPPDPEQAKAQAAVELEGVKGQTTMQVEQAKAATAMQLEQAKAATQIEIKRMELEQQDREHAEKLEFERENAKDEHETRRHEARAAMVQNLAKLKADNENRNADREQKDRHKGADMQLSAASLEADQHENAESRDFEQQENDADREMSFEQSERERAHAAEQAEADRKTAGAGE